MGFGNLIKRILSADEESTKRMKEDAFMLKGSLENNLKVHMQAAHRGFFNPECRECRAMKQTIEELTKKA